MDSLFEILIVLFLIYSLVSSIFAARKKEENSSTGGESSSSPDLFEDLFGTKMPKKTQNENTFSWNPEEEFINIKKSESTIQKETIAKSPVKKLSKPYQEKTTKTKADSIRKKMKDPKTIRELILISEILNKPKAFRK
ncbi:hypothetical protein [Melioribacter sp. OK-6-Me]|uniref:hypothetical protein n=1 Tax=unclassified Melioribacter TaxID=2627329 RepID=UPI003ED848D7